MIIRSQDKKKIIPLNQPVYIVKVADEWAISTERYFLGTYSTEAKAIKVLDMIHAKVMLEYKVFEMTADEDVEV